MGAGEGARGQKRPGEASGHKCGRKIRSKVVNKEFGGHREYAEPVGADNSRAGLKAPFVWTGQGVEGQISPIHDTPSVATLAHTQTYTGIHTATYVRGTFPAFGAEADLGEFNLGRANFSLRGQGWRWRLCGGGGCVKGRGTKRRFSLFSADCRQEEEEKSGWGLTPSAAGQV